MDFEYIYFNRMNIISIHNGYKQIKGKDAGKWKNPYQICKDDKGLYIEMFDSKNNIFTFDYEDLNKVNLKTNNKNRPSWYVAKTGETSDNNRNLCYVCCKQNEKTIYIHALIMNHMNHGKGQCSVDHIDKNPLNNRKYNLRIISQSEQNKNTIKRCRKYNAIKLPDDIKQIDLPKYVTFNYKRKIGENQYTNSFFRIENHPAFKNKYRWNSTCSTKYSNNYKLNQTKQQLNIINKLSENPDNIGKIDKNFLDLYT